MIHKMATLIDIDPTNPFQTQLHSPDLVGPIVLINTFLVPPGQLPLCISIWRESALIAKRHPGCVSVQLHREIGQNSNVVINYAVWESVSALRECQGSKDFLEAVARFPRGTECRIGISQMVDVEGVCGGV